MEIWVLFPDLPLSFSVQTVLYSGKQCIQYCQYTLTTSLHSMVSRLLTTLTCTRLKGYGFKDWDTLIKALKEIFMVKF